ncbi:transcription factor TFIIIC subunit TFC8 PWA37_003700 [Arxiozyma heterogenica]|uniref:transcription factor TFIIIC subunit TFC8 n=1 Tax=Arxiozyma heterogenica TaxID=278026 RepID=UPI002F258F36
MKAKLLKDLVVLRKEFQQWDRVLTWSEDGTLYFSTIPEFTVGQPLYSKDIKRSSKDLFHLTSIDFPIMDNKLEFEDSKDNILLNSQPQSYIRMCKPCPYNSSLIAAITNNGNIIIYHDYKPILNMDQEGRNLQERTYHSFAWDVKGNTLAVGNESSELILFSIDYSTNTYSSKTVKLSDGNGWITKIVWNNFGLIAASSDNTVYFMQDLDKQEPISTIILPSSRFKINDLLLMKKTVFVSVCGNIFKINISTGQRINVAVDPTCEYLFIPLYMNNEVILLSNKASHIVKLLDDDIILHPDNIVFPYLKKKRQKWQDLGNQYNKYEIDLSIYGLALSLDQYSVAIAYSIQRVSFKYKIMSENKFNVMFIPLYESWSLSSKGSGMLWFQTYNIYGKQLPVTPNNSVNTTEDNNIDTDLEFVDYLNMLVKTSAIIKRMFQNMIDPDSISMVLFRESILKYAKAHKDKLINPMDKLCVESLFEILRKESIFEIKNDDTIVIKGEFIEQTFNIFGNGNQQIINSIEGNSWRRCSLTLLPLLTTNTKICPASNQRIINIKKDIQNDYGWFTRTLLEFFNDKSPYTGGKFSEST